MIRQIATVLLMLSPFPFDSASSQTPFSTDSASAYLRTIAVDIGARPMGSPQEHAAMEFALQKFREFGLNDAYIMPMNAYPGFRFGGPVNTRSGIAIGVLRGSTDRTIVIGAHIDSADPEVPGANDDGSGTAVILELARVLAQRRNESTIVFTLFGGEEAGDQGSKYFVDHYADLNKVDLMLQVDMANGSPLLFPTLDAGEFSAPEWLVRASYEEFSKLGYAGLHFPTDFFVFMGALPGGGVGSDHQSFLEKSIPAIDFTSDARDPIHSPQDNIGNFKFSGLKRSGDLIYKLVERFDTGVPAEKSSTYFLYEVATFPFFVPIWVLTVFVLLSIVVALTAIIVVRQRRDRHEGTTKPKIPGLKLFLLSLIIQCCVWFSENLVALIKGVRYPWMADINGYYVLGFFAACIGIWISLQLSPKMNIRHDPYSYFLRAGILLLLLVLLGFLSSVKLALYPATALLLLALAMLVRQPILKLLFWLLSPLFMFRLMFSEQFDFIARAVHEQPAITPSVNLVLQVIWIIFFSVWSFPFLLGFAAIYFDSNLNRVSLKLISNRTFGLVATLLFLGTVAVLSQRESYSQEWKPMIRIEQTFNADSSRGDLMVQGTESLKGDQLIFPGHDTTLSKGSTEAFFPKALARPLEPWITVQRTVGTTRSDSTLQVDLLLKVDTKFRPFQLTVGYIGSQTNLRNVSSPLAFSSKDRSVTLQWSAFPDTSLSIPISFSIRNIDTLQIRERIEAIFVEGIEPVSITPVLPSSVTTRSTVVREETIRLR